MNRLRELRELNGWSQEELGKLLNVQKSAISKYETGRVLLNEDLIKKLCTFFNTSSDYLLGLSDTNEPFQLDIPFTAEEKSLIDLYRRLSDKMKSEITGEIKGILRATEEQCAVLNNKADSKKVI